MLTTSARGCTRNAPTQTAATATATAVNRPAARQPTAATSKTMATARPGHAVAFMPAAMPRATPAAISARPRR